MSSSQRRAGKTAPRLIHDLHQYDPAHPPGTRRNLLSEVPPVYPERYNGPLDYISQSACRHEYMTKPNQSVLLQTEHDLGPAGPVRICAICVKCRYHLQVTVFYPDVLAQQDQVARDHIHHLIYTSGAQWGGARPAETTPKGQVVETFHYECSYLTCSATVTVRVASPVLGDEHVRMMTDPALLQVRADEAHAAQPERLEGVARPQPINVLENLRTYIRNALQDPQRSRSILSINKRFMICFGVNGLPCKDLLEFLGFSNKNEGFWDPPQPSPWKEVPYQDPSRIFLDDVDWELTALIAQRPASEKKGHTVEHAFRGAYNDLCYALGVLDYPKALNADDFSLPSGPYYEDLGVLEDMSASAIIEAFNRQVACDPARTPLYLKCLKEIGALRGGQDAAFISDIVNLAYSEGKYTDEDVVAAYKYFGLSHDDPNLTEDSIIGKFYAFLSSTVQETETRKKLWIIGDSRRSERIKSAAEDRVSTVEQAHVFLGVDDKTTDDFIITMFTAKISDNPSSKDLARRAVELIANARKSDALKHYLSTGETGTGEMDVGDAYRLLQIPDRTVDDSAIMAAYTICVDEAPAQAETYNRALSIIAREKNSPLLNSLIPGAATQPDRDLSEWPVGLQNIGNTCYLNSLLQFYFSVRPFREMVLDFETYQMDLDDAESLARKQVGSRKVSVKEVERSQKFLKELQNLFRNMITSPHPSVTPEQELARLTLISSTNEAAIRRRSTISASRMGGGLGEINGVPVAGPLGPSQQTITIPHDAAASEPLHSETARSVKDISMIDVDSEATLVSDGMKSDQPVSAAEDKENASPATVEVNGEVNVASRVEGGGPSRVHSEPSTGPSTQPPPVPPRPNAEADRQKQIKEEVEIGAQQDVTEVINNVLFQSQCGIKPTDFASDGEQLDRIKDLFYGKTKSYISVEDTVRSKEEWWCDIKVDVATGSRDIYAAIDGAFDAQKVDVQGKVAEQFGAISKLSPVLQIQVQRVQFDTVKKTSFKSTNHLELLEMIYMDRYMDTQHPGIVSRRKVSWQLKEKVKNLAARRAELERQQESDGLDVPTLLSSAKGILDDLVSMKADPEVADEAIDIEPNLTRELDHLSQLTRTELSYIDQEIMDTQRMISSQFTDFRKLAYRLYAVFMHRGSVSFGHYWIYIFDFHKQVWRKYNDEQVTEVQNPEEIFRSEDSRNPPTPYFLVYLNDSLKDRLADPVCRNIMTPASESQHGGGDAPAAETGAAPAPAPAATNAEEVETGAVLDDPVPMEGVTPTETTVEAVDGVPPSYEDVCTGTGAPGTNDASVSSVSSPAEEA